MRLVMRKPVFEVSDQIRCKPAFMVTQTSWRLKISEIATIVDILFLLLTRKLFVYLG